MSAAAQLPAPATMPLATFVHEHVAKVGHAKHAVNCWLAYRDQLAAADLKDAWGALVAQLREVLGEHAPPNTSAWLRASCALEAAERATAPAKPAPKAARSKPVPPPAVRVERDVAAEIEAAIGAVADVVDVDGVHLQLERARKCGAITPEAATALRGLLDDAHRVYARLAARS